MGVTDKMRLSDREAGDMGGWLVGWLTVGRMDWMDGWRWDGEEA